MWPRPCNTGVPFTLGLETPPASAYRAGHNGTMAHTQAQHRHLVGWLSLAQLITWGSVFYAFAVLMEPLERELGLSRAQSSLAFSLALLAEGLLAYPVGRWIEQGHERAVMTGGSLLVVLCLAAHSQVHSLAAFYAVWTGLGVALSATLYTPAFAVITRRYPNDFRRAIITLTFLGGLASTVFTPLTAWLIHLFGWRHALLLLGLFNLLLCVPIHAVMLRGPSRTVCPKMQRLPVPPISQYLRSPTFILISAFVVLMMGVTAALPAHMVSLLRETGLSESWVIAIPASMGIIQVLGRLLLYFFEYRFDVHVANRIIPMLIPLGLLALILGSGHGEAALLFVLLYGLGNGMLTIVKGTAMAQYVSREHMASLNGALGVPLALARAGAPLMLGMLWNAQIGYGLGLWLLLMASIAAVGALWLAQHRSRVPEH